MRSREEVVKFLHQKTFGVHNELSIQRVPIHVGPLLELLEFCGVIGEPKAQAAKDGLKK